MASKVAEEHNNTETEEGTMEPRKKRSRRVSFAEMTSVHFFDREEEYETPPGSGPPGSGDRHSELAHSDDEVVGFRLEPSSEANGSKDSSRSEYGYDDEDEELVIRRSFLRPFESPSPGSPMGSATSNDEDNFFGPVSASFIRPGRLSDSAVSDENHDITMDSTAFSMHFHSLARSDTGGDLKTPTGIHRPIEDKTSSYSNPGSSMVITVAKKPMPQSRMSVGQSSGVSDSSDMSLVGETAHRYDYARLSPRLDALLAEGAKGLHGISIDKIIVSTSPRNTETDFLPAKEHGSDLRDLGDSRDKERDGIETSHDLKSEVGSDANGILREASGDLEIFPGVPGCSFSASSRSPINHQDLSPNQLNKGILESKTSDHIKDSFETKRTETHLSIVSSGTLSDLDVQFRQSEEITPLLHESPLSSSSSRQRLVLLNSSSPSKDPLIATPSQKQFGSFVSNENYASASSIQKSISKLNMLEASPFSSTLSARLGNSKRRSLHYLETPPIDTVLEKNDKDSEVLKRGLSPSSPSIDINKYKDLRGVHMEGRENNFSDLRDASRTSGNLKTLRRDGEYQDPDGNLQSGRDLDMFKSDSLGGLMKTTSHDLASPSSYGNGNEPSLQKNFVELFTQSPLRKELFQLTHKDIVDSFVGGDVPSPISNDFADGSQHSSPWKRRNEEIAQGRDHMNEMVTIQKSPKLLKVGIVSSNCLQHPDDVNSGTSTISPEPKSCADICSKFSRDIRQLLPPSTNNLSLETVDVLEDIITHLQRLKSYEMLGTKVHFQKKFEGLSDNQHKKLSEARLLVHRIVHEQAKLQLMRVKKEKLLNKLESLSSRIEESQMLKMNSLPRLAVPCERDAQAKSLLINSDDTQEVPCEKVTAMRQTLEASQKKIMNLSKFFHTYYKIRREPSCVDTIALVNDQLMKKRCCRILRQDLQLWDVDNVESRDNCHNVFLNYHGFVTQRFSLTLGPTSSILITNKFNDIKIMKSFPAMDAYTAFTFVLNAETNRKYVGPRSLAQETQMTSSLLGNLLDVIQEVQLARAEHQNLIQTNFHSSSAEQLDLQLCFFDFKSGGKLMMTLDMSCLNRAIYPSEVVPSTLASPVDGSQLLMPLPLILKIETAIQNLKSGYMRIIQLCRCVSEVIQSSN